MTDTVVVSDTFTGAAGTLDGHTPTTQTTGTATYDTPSHMLLDGSGNAVRADRLGQATLRGTTIDPSLGVYWELTYTPGTWGGTGPQTMEGFSGLDSGDMPNTSITLYGPNTDYPGGSLNKIYASDTVLTSVLIGTTTSYITVGTPATLRCEIDPYAQTTKFFINGVLVHTSDDSAWYFGTETFAPSSWVIGAKGNALNVDPGGSTESTTAILTTGTLGLSPPAAKFWTNFINSTES
jgi:hypothetical protein